MASSARIFAFILVFIATPLALSSGCDTEKSVPRRDLELRILFESDQDGDYEIYAAKADGSGLVALTQNADEDVDPSWSHDRSKIAFCSDRDRPEPGTDIWIMDADGSNPRRLTRATHARQPAWAPGDSLLVFVSGSGDEAELVLIGSDGSHRAVLTHNDVPDLDPVWTPDGMLLFRSDRDGDGEIFLLDPATKSLQQLTHNDVLDEEPTVSRDGERVFYVSHASGRAEIVAMQRDGSGAVQITSSGAAQPCAGMQSDTIAFVHEPSSGGEIALMTMDGASMRKLTQSGFRSLGPAW